MMLKGSNGIVFTDDEVCDLVSALRDKAASDRQIAESLMSRADAEQLDSDREHRRRLALTFKEQADRGDRLADEIEAF